MASISAHAPIRTHPQPDRLTRDRQLVGFVGRHGVVAIEQVMAALGVGRASAYRRVAHCIDRGLLERLELLRREPSLLRATRRGLRFAGLGLPPAEVSLVAIDHSLRCASVALMLGREIGAARVLSERELIQAERLEDRQIAAARIGTRLDGAPRFHRPDLVILPENHPLTSRVSPGSGELAPSPAAHARTRERGREIPGDHERAPAEAEDMRVVAIEVELTPKSPRRLEAIVRGWRRAGQVAEVRYYCAPGPTRGAVERAVRKTRSEERVRILEVPAR